MSQSLVDLGILVKNLRKESGISIDDASNSLKIPAKFLRKIEDGDQIDTISNTITIMFIKSYLEYLGDSSSEILQKYKIYFENIKRNRTLDECAVINDQSPKTLDFKIALIITVILLASSLLIKNNRDINLKESAEEIVFYKALCEKGGCD